MRFPLSIRRSSRTPAPFDAAVWGTPVLWVSPYDSTKRTDNGSVVSALTDRSAGAIVVDQSTAGLRPTLRVAGFGTKDCVDFSSTLFFNLGTRPTMTSAGGFSIIAAISVPSGRLVPMEILGGDASATRVELRVNTDGTLQLIANNVAVIATSVLTVANDTPTIVGCTYDGATVNFWFNGVADTPISASQGITGGPLLIGMSFGTVTQVGRLAELACYGTLLSPSNMINGSLSMKSYLIS